MDQAWHSQVGQRIALEAQRAAVRHLTRLAIQYPEEWHKARDLALEWGLLPEFHSHLLTVYRRIKWRNNGQ